MSDTDIYKQREPMPFGSKQPSKKRRRRARPQRAFDDKSRKRRSKNTGLRRLLHISRKGENEKYFWTVLAVLFVAILIIIGVWQFIIMEHLIRTEEKKDDYIEYQREVPQSKEPLLPPPTASAAE